MTTVNVIHKAIDRIDSVQRYICFFLEIIYLLNDIKNQIELFVVLEEWPMFGVNYFLLNIVELVELHFIRNENKF